MSANPTSVPVRASRDRNAFEREWQRVAPRVGTLARRDRDVWSRPFEDEDDLRQEIAIVLWRRLAKTRVENPFGLACKVAHDLGVDRRRRASAVLVELSAATEPSVDPVVDELLDVRRSDREVDELLREYLTPEEREAVRLRLAGHRLPEAAASMGVSKQHHKDLLKLARRKLALPLQTMRRHGRCRMVASRIEAYARGELARNDAAWQVAARHLAGCSSCRRQVTARRSGHPRPISEQRRRSVGPLS